MSCISLNIIILQTYLKTKKNKLAYMSYEQTWFPGLQLIEINLNYSPKVYERILMHKNQICK